MYFKKCFNNFGLIQIAALLLSIHLQESSTLPAIPSQSGSTLNPAAFNTVINTQNVNLPSTPTPIKNILTTTSKPILTTTKIIMETSKIIPTTLKPVTTTPKFGVTPLQTTTKLITTIPPFKTTTRPRNKSNTFNPYAIPDLENFVKRIRNESRGRPDMATGRLVSAWRPGYNHPEELGSYTQGDILTLKSQPRAGIMDLSYRWPNGIVYYNISGPFSDVQRSLILAAMNEYHQNTCVRFVQYNGSQTDFVSVEGTPTGCWSNLGRNGGKQYVNFQIPNCFYYIGTIIHELMHVIGFFHEQSRMDRDQYIGVAYENVIPGREYNFDTYESFTYNVSYDYGSVMHYSQYAFTKNNIPTINKPPSVSIGQRLAFSALDIEKIRAMYMCVGNVSTLPL